MDKHSSLDCKPIWILINFFVVGEVVFIVGFVFSFSNPVLLSPRRLRTLMWRQWWSWEKRSPLQTPSTSALRARRVVSTVWSQWCSVTDSLLLQRRRTRCTARWLAPSSFAPSYRHESPAEKCSSTSIMLTNSNVTSRQVENRLGGETLPVWSLGCPEVDGFRRTAVWELFCFCFFYWVSWLKSLIINKGKPFFVYHDNFFSLLCPRSIDSVLSSVLVCVCSERLTLSPLCNFFQKGRFPSYGETGIAVCGGGRVNLLNCFICTGLCSVAVMEYISYPAGRRPQFQPLWWWIELLRAVWGACYSSHSLTLTSIVSFFFFFF